MADTDVSTLLREASEGVDVSKHFFKRAASRDHGKASVRLTSQVAYLLLMVSGASLITHLSRSKMFISQADTL